MNEAHIVIFMLNIDTPCTFLIDLLYIGKVI